MGKRGPRPTPTKILSNRDSWRAKINEGEPIPVVEDVDKPEIFGVNDLASEAWDTFSTDLKNMGLFHSCDRHALIAMCFTWSNWWTAQEFISLRGQHYTHDDKYRGKIIRTFPQVAVAQAEFKNLIRMFQEFGLTPSARSNVQVAPNTKSEDDKKRRFLRLN